MNHSRAFLYTGRIVAVEPGQITIKIDLPEEIAQKHRLRKGQTVLVIKKRGTS